VPDDPQPPAAFEFDGAWPFTGTPAVNGNRVTTCSAFTVTAANDGTPVVTLTLVGPDALRLIFASEAARVAVDDQTAAALASLGWTPPPPPR
jgi:hypothetical protein